MAKRYFCEGCNKGCKNGEVHTYEHTCSDCMLSPPCISMGLEFHVTYAKDILGVRHAMITTKKRKVKVRRVHVSFVSVVIRAAL